MKKWSEQLRICFLTEGKPWDDDLEAEIKELLENTENEWITNFNGTGVNGRKFISKTDTSKYIFIPAAGYCSNGSEQYVGYYGNVWTSSLLNSNPNGAWYLGFGSDDCYMGDGYRYDGQSVRGVMD